MPYIGTQPKDVRSFGKVQFDFTATQGQTAFTGADDDGKTLGFTEGQIQVYVNGILMDASDYTTSNTNTVTLVSAANLNDIITVVALQTDIPNSDYVPISGGTFTGNVSGATADFSGNVGIGTSSVPAAARAMVSGGRFYVNSQDQYSVLLQNGGTSGGFIGTTGGDTINFFSSGGTERMRIDSAGRVTMPYQPAFLCRPPASHSIAAGDHIVTGTWSSDYNIGNNFNTSNGSFTAPVAGVYVFNWAIFASGSLGSRSDAFIRVNGNIKLRTEINSYNAGSTNRSQHVHGQLKLSANDIVTFGTYQTNACTIYPTVTPWSYAAGYLLG